MATGAIFTRKRIISQHVYSSVRSIQSFQGLGHGYNSSAYSSLGYYQHNIKERDENLVTKPHEFTVIGGDKVRSEMFLTMGMRFRSLSIHSASAATAKKPESVKDDEEKEIMAAKRRNEASPEECYQAVEGLSSVKAKAKAKQLADSQKVAKSILQRARTIIVGIGVSLRAIASMSSIKHDDRLIQSEGAESLSEAELHEDCREGGMVELHSVEDMRKQLRNWLDLSLNYSVPSSLLILSRILLSNTISRAFTVSGKLKPEEAVQATLSSLPDEVVDTVSIISLPSEDFVSERSKLEYIEMQEELIKEEEELARMKESEISEDVALKEMSTLTAGEAQERARERMLEKQEELCEVSRALAVFASASSVSTEREKFSRLVNKEMDLFNGMALRRARTASSALFGRFLQYPPISLSIVHSSNAYRQFSTGMTVADNQTLLENMKRELLHLDVTSQIGSCMPLAAMRIGTMIHNIEVNPGQGGKLVRAAGTCAKILKEPTSRYCLVKLPSGDEKWIDSRCRATVGTVSNPSHGARKLRKAGQSRWLGRRPVVRGVAMNPIDHPHGGGEGKSKSSGNHGRCSMTPWGKPCKGGYKTANPKRKKSGPPMRS